MSDDEIQRDDVLRRMLRTPPMRHIHDSSKRPRPEWVEKFEEEVAKGADTDLDKMARLIGTRE
jgi:hypothetical protein